MGTLNADLYVLEYALQARGAEGIDNNLVRFCRTISERHPEARILILTPTFDVSERYGDGEIEERRQAFRRGYTLLRESGAPVHLVDGLDLLGPDDDDVSAHPVLPGNAGRPRRGAGLRRSARGKVAAAPK